MHSKKKHSVLEENFFFIWQKKYPEIELTREYRVIPSRKFLFDFAHLQTNTAIEIQGGNYCKGRRAHSSATGLNRDYEKFNLAQLYNWEVYQLDTKMVTENWIIRIGDRILYKLICWEMIVDNHEISK